VRADLRGKRQKGLVVATGCGQLHATARAWNGDRGSACEAEGRRVAQQAHACLGVISAGGEARNGDRGQQDELMGGEEFVHARAERFVTPSQGGDFGLSEAGAPQEAIPYGRRELIEVAGVNFGGFNGLQGRINFDGISPPIGLDASSFQSKILKVANDAAETGDDLGLAIVKKAVVDKGEAREAAGR
jgi:hypothetical protein